MHFKNSTYHAYLAQFSLLYTQKRDIVLGISSAEWVRCRYIGYFLESTDSRAASCDKVWCVPEVLTRLYDQHHKLPVT